MPQEVHIWKIEPGDQLRDLPAGRLNLESRLDTWITKNIDVLDPWLLVIRK